MNARRLDLVWVILMAGTAATWWIGESGSAGPSAVLAILAIAVVKGVGIIREFMALRGVKVVWQVAVIGWLLVVLAIIAATYSKGVP
jgi:hypothetical protein